MGAAVEQLGDSKVSGGATDQPPPYIKKTKTYFMPTSINDKHFAELMAGEVEMLSMSALDSAITWIAANLNPDEVFSEHDLSNWAERNGFTKE